VTRAKQAASESTQDAAMCFMGVGKGNGGVAGV
jgi:hypothetical protein